MDLAAVIARELYQRPPRSIVPSLPMHLRILPRGVQRLCLYRLWIKLGVPSPNHADSLANFRCRALYWMSL